MTNQWSTTVSDWQGVDDKPNFGSKNLVYSEGIAKSLDGIVVNEQKDKFYLTDKNGYVIGYFDKDGLHITEISVLKDGVLTGLLDLLDEKVNKDGTKVLSQNDFTDLLKNKLENIQEGATNNDNIINEEDSAFYITDKRGYISLKSDKNGLGINNYVFTNKDSFYVTDERGYVVLKIDRDGVDYPGIVKMSDLPTFDKDELIPNAKMGSDINFYIAHGQSNSANGNYPIPAYNFYDALCFASKTLDCSPTIDGMTDEQLYNYLGNGFASMNEYTGTLLTVGGCMVKWMEKLKAALHLESYDSLKYQFIGARTGYVTNVDALTDPSQLHYNRILRTISAGKHFADAINKTVALPVIAYIQNESNSSMTYKHVYDMLWVFGSNINYDVKAITGQDYEVKIVLYQTTLRFPESDRAMLQLSIDTGTAEAGYVLDETAASYLKSGVDLIDRSVFLWSMPFYPYKTYENVTPLHLDWNAGLFNVLGAYFGLDAAKTINFGESQKVLHPKSHSVKSVGSNYILEVEFDVPTEPLQFKPYSTRFGNNASLTAVDGIEPNYGFAFYDGNDDRVNIIESVEIVRLNKVKFVLTQNPVGLSLYYARGGSNSGGNLCDSQGQIESFMVGSDKYDMDNWCPMFVYEIN